MCRTLHSPGYAQISIFTGFTVNETISIFSITVELQKKKRRKERKDSQTDLEYSAVPIWGKCEGLKLIVITKDKCLGDHLHLRFNDSCWNLMTVS